MAVLRRLAAPAAPPLTALGLAFALGVGALYLLPALPPRWAAWTLAALLLPPALLRRWLPVAAGAGLLWAYLHACAVLCAPLPADLMGRTLIADGQVVSVPDTGETATRFLFRIAGLRLGDETVDYRGLVRLSWYRDPPPIAAGERWRLAVRLKPPHGFANPGGFDYERWLFQQGISATGHVREDDANRLLDPGAGHLALDRWRQRLRERLAETLDGAGVARALIPALVIGDRGGLTPGQWEVFARTGTSHLIAISGLHVGLVAGFVFFLARWAWARSVRLTHRLAAPRAAALAALGAAAGYAALAGFAISTQRALVMLAVLMLALVAGRTLRPAGALILALTAVLLLDPASVLSYGFWLSFGAVAVLLYALGRRLAPPGLVWGWGRAQWAVALGLLPLLLVFFGRASLAAPLVNLVAVPLFTVLLPLVLIAAALSLLTGWTLPLSSVAWLLDQGYAGLAWVAASPMASVTLGGRPDWVWLAAFAGVLLLLAPRGLPGRWLGTVLLLPLLLMRPPLPPPGTAWLTLLDVGQGLSAVVRTHAHTLVYDLGPRFPSGFETGSAVVAPFLREAGARRVDRLVASHADQDHVGGLSGLSAALPVADVISGEPADLDAAGARPCRAGQHWQWDGVRFDVLHPDHGGYAGNDASCVLRVSTGAGALLLTGDVEQDVEAMLVERHRAGCALASEPDSGCPGLAADILIAAHHGSATSSGLAFLRAVAPSLMLYSAGFGNRWGFPSAEVRARVQALGIASADTAAGGALRIDLPASGDLAPPIRQRDADRRIWRHRPGR